MGDDGKRIVGMVCRKGSMGKTVLGYLYEDQNGGLISPFTVMSERDILEPAGTISPQMAKLVPALIDRKSVG